MEIIYEYAPTKQGQKNRAECPFCNKKNGVIRDENKNDSFLFLEIVSEFFLSFRPQWK